MTRIIVSINGIAPAQGYAASILKDAAYPINCNFSSFWKIFFFLIEDDPVLFHN